jgi:hypothetical protein
MAFLEVVRGGTYYSIKSGRSLLVFINAFSRAAEITEEELLFRKKSFLYYSFEDIKRKYLWEESIWMN